MLIGIISDTHDRLPSIDDAFDCFRRLGVKLVLHCGDWTSLDALRYFSEAAQKFNLPWHGVLGNNDLSPDMKKMPDSAGQFLGDTWVGTVSGRRLCIYHGHHKPTLARLLNSTDHDTLFLGHSHKPKIELVNEKLILNPGSVAFTIPRSKGDNRTIGMYDTGSNEGRILRLSGC